MLFRVGVRKNDTKSIENAKTKILHLFFGRNHPIYQNIMYLDTLDTISMPEELKNLKKQFMSSSRTGNIDKSQGGDALLEHGVIILNRSNNSYISIETSAPQQAGGFIIKYYFGISNITACR